MYGCWGGAGLEEPTFPVDVRQVALDWGQSQASPLYPWRGGCMGVWSGLEELTFPVDERQEALDWGQSQASPSYRWRGGCMGVGGGVGS